MTRPALSVAAAAPGIAPACTPDASQPVPPAAIPPAPLSSLHGRIAYSTLGGNNWVMNAKGLA